MSLKIAAADLGSIPDNHAAMMDPLHVGSSSVNRVEGRKSGLTLPEIRTYVSGSQVLADHRSAPAATVSVMLACIAGRRQAVGLL